MEAYKPPRFWQNIQFTEPELLARIEKQKQESHNYRCNLANAVGHLYFLEALHAERFCGGRLHEEATAEHKAICHAALAKLTDQEKRALGLRL